MRKRLTSKTLFAENRKDGIFPGDIGNEERSEKYYNVDEFNNEASEFEPGWDLPEKNDIKDERDEMNFGVKKDVKAQKARFNAFLRATLMAQAFLGPKATESQIKWQAAQFYKMGPASVSASMKLWKATEEVEDEIEAPKTETAEEEVTAPAVEAPEIEAEDEAPAETTEAPAEEVVEKTEDVSEIEAEETEETADAPVEAEEIECPECGTPIDTEMELNVEADPVLEAAFSGEEVEVPEEKPVASVTAKKKQGISHMAQPKLTTASVKSDDRQMLDNIFLSDLAVTEHL